MIVITEKKNCCGCTACEQICPVHCIEMKEDEEGFLYPKANAGKCIHCNACDRVCPIQNYQKQVNFEQVAYMLQNKDQQVLRESTSGGVFTEIARYVIRNGGVVYGAAIGSDYIVRHIPVTNEEELWRFRNSKYVQSNVEDTFSQVKEQLKGGKMVCFSGTPCQIEGLLQFLGRKPENLILVDVVCRAVPSPGVWKKYIESEVSRHGDAISIRFRDKKLGYQYSTMKIAMKDGYCERGGVESSIWLRLFFSGMIIRPSCAACKFRSPYRKSDFTIWDCFPTYKFDKSWDENSGTTRMLIHTEKGKRIFAIISSRFEVKELSVSEAIAGVREMALSPKENEKKELFFQELNENDIEQAIDRYFPTTGKVKFKKSMRIFLNRYGLDKTVKHILKRG